MRVQRIGQGARGPQAGLLAGGRRLVRRGGRGGAGQRGAAARAAVAGRVVPGTAGSLALKSNSEVRSPQTARRQGEMLGSATPKRCSMKRSTEVWSKTCELTQPPRDQGDSAYMGTRGPRP